jgi:hypothetical protein
MSTETGGGSDSSPRQSAENGGSGGMPQTAGGMAQSPANAAKRAYGLFARGMDLEAIAAEVGVPADTVAVWVGDWAVRGTQDGDPKRAVAGEALRVVLRTLFVNINAADVRDKPKYASAIAQIESKLVQLDGRCGAKVEGGYCREYPARGRNRCYVHGGGTLVGRMSGTYEHGRRSRFPFADEALAERAQEIRGSDPFEGMLDDIATARVTYHQAVWEGRSGVAELRAANDAIAKYAKITAGKKMVHVPDEAAARALFGAIYGCVREAANEVLGQPGMAYDGGAQPLLTLVAKKALAIDWSKVNIEVREPIRLVDAGPSSGTIPADS